MKDLLESNTISTINCADEETKVENGVHYRNSHGQKVVGIRSVIGCKIPTPGKKTDLFFLFLPQISSLQYFDHITPLSILRGDHTVSNTQAVMLKGASA